MAAKAHISVLGAGLMGHGIAQVFAAAGHEVAIYDPVAASLDQVKARIIANLRDLGDEETAVERVRPCTDLAEAVRDADFVVEAAPENLGIKRKLFAETEGYVRQDTILASNTSVIPITAIMQDLRERSRALGTHWWNPPYLVPLVEVIGTQWTKPSAIDFTMRLHAAAGKKPAHVKKDVAGFIGNRLQHALWREAVALVEQAIDSRPAPSPYLERLVAEGKLGFKSGEGFRKWTPEAQAALRAKVVQHLKKARADDV